MQKYFGIRNQVQFTPKKGMNYTPEALKTMPTRKEANEIAQIISSYVSPFTISVFPGGLGGVIFALSKKAEIIFVTEPDPNLERILENNIRQYKFKNVEITSEEEPTTFLYVDTFKSPDADIALLLEETEYPYYAFRVANNFDLLEYSGFECHLHTLNENALFVCQRLPESPEEVYEELSNNSEEAIHPFSNAERLDSDVEYERHPFLYKGIENETGPLAYGVTPEYLEGFIVYIRGLLERVIDNPDEYLTPKYIPIWIQAFTSKTVNPKVNYEVLEMVGDRLMKFALADYLTQRIPGITEAQLTGIQNHYLSKPEQNILGRKFGMDKWIRIEGEMTVSAVEDITESFFGALFRISEDIAGGLGYYNSFQMLISLYQDVPFEEEAKKLEKGKAKTRVIQSLKGLHIEPIVNTYEENRIYHSTISLPTRAIEFFEGKGLIMPRILGKGKSGSKRPAEFAAYEKAWDTLQKRGMTDEWLERERNIIAFSAPELQPYLPTARERLEREGYINMTFSIPQSTATEHHYVVQLIGHRPDGTKSILATANVRKTEEGKLEVLKKYASGE